MGLCKQKERLKGVYEVEGFLFYFDRATGNGHVLCIAALKIYT